MQKPFVLPPMRRRRGNPNWGKPGQVPTTVTEFDTQLTKLGLTKQTCVASVELRRWCESHRTRCYIPEWLLEAWGIPIDSIFTA
jgi:hypothetical protein